jgi:hypothetical protein
VSLQKEIRDVDRPALEGIRNITFWGDKIDDFRDTAALADMVDVVVSVDTSVAHLTGSMGKEVLLMIPYSPDWRWFTQRTDSPWYPGFHLFRQTAPGDWPGVFESVSDALRARFDLAPAVKKPAVKKARRSKKSAEA